MNISRKQKQIHRQSKQICGCQRAGGDEGKDWECGISRCKLLYIEWINNKVLLYSPGNYIQYPLLTTVGKEYLKKKKRMSICV